MRFWINTALALLLAVSVSAKEGMWIPYLIGQINHGEMKTLGLELSAEDIYSVNNSSLKDAIVHFNGGCTASLISDQGLLLTNHHCGYSQIQSHSSLENDYLKDGFWAASRKEELKNPGVTASLIKKMEDVTNVVLQGVHSNMTEQERGDHIAATIDSITAARSKESRFTHRIRPFFHGNQYILISRETFKDIRLVGAPPSSIGKFGSDTDNWVWPRHTGDFSLFRIYANKDNLPAQPSEENVPYSPIEHLKVNLNGFENGDFTMVYGFPGTTKQYLPASEVNNIVEIYNPQRIAIRDQILEVLDKKMRKDDATRIKYAAKYAGISNSWKRWQGEIKGLKRTNAVAKKEAFQEEFKSLLQRKGEWMREYGTVLAELDSLYEVRIPIMRERHAYVEIGYYGLEYMRHLLKHRRFVYQYSKLSDTAAGNGMEQKMIRRSRNFMKDFEPALAADIARAILPDYLEEIQTDVPPFLQELQSRSKASLDRFIQRIYNKSVILADTAAWFAQLDTDPKAAAAELAQDSAYLLSNYMYDHFNLIIRPKQQKFEEEIDARQRKYMRALTLTFPKRDFYPNANSTLRLSYGTVQPYEPRDGVTYNTQTYLEGVMEKYVPGDYEFDVPQKLRDLYDAKDYGPYGTKEGMPVCFIATNHTTGGNSGSPAMNGKGELVGLNFDRAWEGTMSDMYYDKSICRNIMVDIRYVLFVIDKYADAGYLVEEMEVVD